MAGRGNQKDKGNNRGSGNGKDPSSGANSDRNKTLDDTKVRAAGRDSGSYPGEEVLRDSGVIHDEQGGAADTTGGTAGSPRGARGGLRDKGPVGGAKGNFEGGESTGGEGEGGGGGGGTASSDLSEVGAAKKRARKR